MSPILLFASLLGSALAAPLDAASCPTDAVYPGDTWTDASIAVRTVHTDAIAALEAYAFAPNLQWGDPDRKGVRTDGVVIFVHGAIAYERYAHNYTPDTRHLAWSASKTVTGMLTGVAVGEGKLDTEASICSYLDLPQTACAVHVRDLMEMGSGFDWHETYEGSSPTASSVLAMLYGQGQPDMARFVAGHPFRDPPGATWYYSSGDTNILSAINGHALSADGGRYPWTRLFDPIGVRSATWERDGSGTYVGSSYLYATPRDLGRLGLLLLNQGCWGDQRLLPEGWTASMATLGKGIQTRAYDRDGDDSYGRQLWLNKTMSSLGSAGSSWPSMPDDTVAMLGHWGQSITVIPEYDMVVVRVADDRDGSFDLDTFLRLSAAVAGHDLPRVAHPPAPAAVPIPTEPKAYDTSLLKVADGFAAKEACSCTFVMGMDEDWCAAYMKVSPDIARFKVDRANKLVTAKALGMAKRTAKYLGPEEGCRLEPLR